MLGKLRDVTHAVQQLGSTLLGTQWCKDLLNLVDSVKAVT